MNLLIHGSCPSGKNQIKTTMIRGRLVRFPDARFKKWRADAAAQIKRQWLKKGRPPRYDEPVRAYIAYYPGDLRRRDAPGMLDAIWHLLEYCGIVKDDGLIQAVNWEQMALDRANPRVEITLGTLHRPLLGSQSFTSEDPAREQAL